MFEPTIEFCFNEHPTRRMHAFSPSALRTRTQISFALQDELVQVITTLCRGIHYSMILSTFGKAQKQRCSGGRAVKWSVTINGSNSTLASTVLSILSHEVHPQMPGRSWEMACPKPSFRGNDIATSYVSRVDRRVTPNLRCIVSISATQFVTQFAAIGHLKAGSNKMIARAAA